VAITSDAPVAVRWLLGRGDVDPNKLGYYRWHHDAPRVPPLLQALRGLRLGVPSVMHAERLACARALLECPRVDLNARCSDGTPLVHHLVKYGHILDALEPADDEYDLSRHGCCRCAHECNRGDFCAPVTCMCHPWMGLHRWCDIEEGTLWADPCSCGNAAPRRQRRVYQYRDANRDRDTNSAMAQGAPAGHVEVAVRGLSTLAMGTGSTPGRLPGPAVSDVDACAILVSCGVWAGVWVDGDSALCCPHMYACACAFPQLRRALLSRHVDINATDARGNRCLQECFSASALSVLCSRPDFDIDAKCHRGFTALAFAVRLGRGGCVARTRP